MTATTYPDADTSAPTLAVETRDLAMRFGDDEVLHGLDLVLEPGTILGLIGPSGCGKTTTVRLMTGLLTPTRGEALVHGTPATELSVSQRERIGYLPQSPALFPDLSLIENLSFHASMYGLPFRRSARLAELLDWVELGDHRRKRVSDASGGMQRRLSLAAAFVQDPDLVFLDEPTAGIDPILRDRLWEKFHDVAAAGKSLVVTTQYVGEAGKCDVVGLLSEGELLLFDTPENLRRAAFSGEVVEVELSRPVGDDAVERLQAQEFVLGDVERTGPTGLRVVVDDAMAMMEEVTSAVEELGVEVVHLDEHIVDYDEAFVRVVQRHRTMMSAAEDTSDGATGTDDAAGEPPAEGEQRRSGEDDDHAPDGTEDRA